MPDAIFHSIAVTSTGFKSSDVVTKTYVDTAAINAVIDGAGSSLDTLKELGTAITSGSTAAAAITANSLSNEHLDRTAVDATLSASIAHEVDMRIELGNGKQAKWKHYESTS